VLSNIAQQGRRRAIAPIINTVAELISATPGECPLNPSFHHGCLAPPAHWENERQPDGFFDPPVHRSDFF